MNGIYKITSPTGRVYIGQSTNLKARFKNYIALRCKSQIKLHRSLLKYGEKNHTFCVLEFCDASVLNERERHYQDFYNSASPDNLNCILTKTTDKPRKISEETRLNYSLAQLASPNSRRGAKHTEYSKGLIKEKRSLQVITESHKQAISDNSGSARMILNIETGIYFRTIKEAAKAHSMTANYLICSLIGRNKNNKQFIYV